MKFLCAFAFLGVARGAWTASTARANPYYTLLASPLSNATVNATGSNPLQRPKSYHVPNSPTTLLFHTYTSPPALAPAVSYHTLVTALHSIYHSTLSNHGDGLIFTDLVSWAYSGAIVTVENHGHDRTGQLTWGMLADTMYGVSAFFEREKCWSGEWMVEVEGLGNIGAGFVGARVDGGLVGVGLEMA